MSANSIFWGLLNKWGVKRYLRGVYRTSQYLRDTMHKCSLTYSDMSNLALDFYFNFWFTGASDFSIIVYPLSCRHKLAQINKHELST